MSFPNYEVSFRIDMDEHRRFIGPKEPFGQMVRRHAAEAEAATLGLMWATLEHMERRGECEASDVAGVMASFGVDIRAIEARA